MPELGTFKFHEFVRKTEEELMGADLTDVLFLAKGADDNIKTGCFNCYRIKDTGEGDLIQRHRAMAAMNLFIVTNIEMLEAFLQSLAKEAVPLQKKFLVGALRMLATEIETGTPSSNKEDKELYTLLEEAHKELRDEICKRARNA